MKRPLSLIFSLLAIAALPLLAACGGDSAAPTASAAGGAVQVQKPADEADASANAAAAPAAPAAEAEIDIAGSQFSPATAKVKVGQKITWTNSDPIAHTVTAIAGAAFDSGTLEGGGTFSYVAKKAGTISYVCDFHPGMTGSITVE